MVLELLIAQIDAELLEGIDGFARDELLFRDEFKAENIEHAEEDVTTFNDILREIIRELAHHFSEEIIIHRTSKRVAEANSLLARDTTLGGTAMEPTQT